MLGILSQGGLQSKLESSKLRASSREFGLEKCRELLASRIAGGPPLSTAFAFAPSGVGERRDEVSPARQRRVEAGNKPEARRTAVIRSPSSRTRILCCE